MRVMDDDRLIEELRDGIRRRTEAIDAPEGFGRETTRLARQRTARRRALVGMPVVAAACAAAVVAIVGGHSSSHPGVTLGSARGRDTAYVARHVRARIAADPQGVVVREITTQNASAHCPCGGFLTYTDPRSGVFYDHWITPKPGNGPPPVQLEWTEQVRTPVGHDSVSYLYTYLDPTSHTWGNATDSGAAGPAGPSLNSSTQQIQQALASGEVAQTGSTTIDGQSALSLSIQDPLGHDQRTTISETLYVNAQTYEPIETVWIDHAPPLARPPAKPTGAALTSTWLPATAANVAAAKATDVPAGYTQVPTRSLDSIEAGS